MNRNTTNDHASSRGRRTAGLHHHGYGFCCAGLYSSAGAAVCCPYVGASQTWTTGTYWDQNGIEGAHSCLAYFSVSQSTYAAANAVCARAFLSGGHLVTAVHKASMAVQGSNVLSVAAGLAKPTACGSPAAYSSIGATPSSFSSTPTSWAWVDGTPAGNLNCGANNCGFWASGCPRFARASETTLL